MKTMRWSRAIGGPRTDWEKNAILGFHTSHPLEGYRRLTFMMLDANIVAINAIQRPPAPRCWIAERS